MSIDKFIIPVFIISNYSTWATQIEHILCVHDVWEIVSGTEKEPKENDPKYGSEVDQESIFDFEQDSKAYKAKVARANATVFANMSQTIVEEHKKYKVPSILWQTLQKRYAPRTTVSRISAGCDFANARMNGDSESVPEYLTRLQRLRDHFADCGGIVDEAMYKGKMFEGLPDGYHALEANVKINGDDVLPEEVKDHILEHYRVVQQRSNTTSDTSNSKVYTAQQRINFTGKSSNDNGNAGGNRGKNGKFDGFEKNHAHRDDQKE